MPEGERLGATGRARSPRLGDESLLRRWRQLHAARTDPAIRRRGRELRRALADEGLRAASWANPDPEPHPPPA